MKSSSYERGLEFDASLGPQCSFSRTGGKCQSKCNFNRGGKFLKKLSVVLRRWGSIAGSLSIINRVDNANWPILSSHRREFKADVSSVSPSSERKFFLYCLLIHVTWIGECLIEMMTVAVMGM